MLMDGKGGLPRSSFALKWATVTALLWLGLSVGGVMRQPTEPPPPLSVARHYQLSGPTTLVQEVGESLRLYFPDYTQDSQGYPIILALNPNMPAGGVAFKTRTGGCLILLNPAHSSYSTLRTPAHEFNHCRRDDPAIQPGFGGFLYYYYVEVFPMPLDLSWRWIQDRLRKRAK